jgi:hypothetical protein
MAVTTGQLDTTLRRMEHGRRLKGELLMNTSDNWVPYAQPLLDAVSLFEELKLGYALIGGIASMYYGRSRFTEDVDFVVATGHMDILRTHPAEMARHHFASDCVHKLYHQSGVQVDVWKDEHSDDIISRAVNVELAGRKVRMIEPHDLIAMKLRAGRLKDDYDISQILQGTAIDSQLLQAKVTDEEWSRFTSIQRRS